MTILRDIAALASMALFLTAVIVWMAILEDSRPPQVELTIETIIAGVQP